MRREPHPRALAEVAELVGEHAGELGQGQSGDERQADAQHERRSLALQQPELEAGAGVHLGVDHDAIGHRRADDLGQPLDEREEQRLIASPQRHVVRGAARRAKSGLIRNSGTAPPQSSGTTYAKRRMRDRADRSVEEQAEPMRRPPEDGPHRCRDERQVEERQHDHRRANEQQAEQIGNGRRRTRQRTVETGDQLLVVRGVLRRFLVVMDRIPTLQPRLPAGSSPASGTTSPSPGARNRLRSRPCCFVYISK